MADKDQTDVEEYEPRSPEDAFSEDVLGLGDDGFMYDGDTKSDGHPYDPSNS